MEGNRYDSFPMASKGEAAVVNYHQIAGREEDDGFTTRYSPVHSSEQPKSVLEKGLHFSKFTIHIMALATTAAVVGVNFITVYGWDQGTLRISDNQVNNLLQFAAKLHELFIVGSLTSMVMHRIRKRLCSSKGLPFGLLSSGYQVSSAEFLFSSSLWSAFSRDGWLILTLAATIIFANVVGPSSAIAMIPRLDWWVVHAPFNTPLHLYLDSSLDALYPTKLGPPNMTLYPGCDTAAYTSGCPGAAFDDLRNWAASWYNNGVAPNISMTEVTTNAQRAMLTETAHLTLDISITTTLTQPILELIGLFWDYIQVNPVGKINNIKQPMIVSTETAPVYAPVVQVQCTVFNYSDAIKSPGPNNTLVSFPLDVLDSYTGISTSNAWPVDPLLWNFTRPMNATNFTWVDVSSYSDGDGPGASLGALITLPTLAVDGARENDTFWDLSQQSLLIPCLINAKWAAAKIQYEAKNSNQLVQNITEPGIFSVGDGQNVTEASKQPWGLSETIYISPEWAALLNVAGIASTFPSGESLNATMMEALLSQFVASDTNSIYSPYMALGAKYAAFAPPQTYNVLPATIAAVVSEGLSRQAYKWTKPYLVFDEGPNNTTFTNLEQQKGWNSSGLGITNMSLDAFDAIVDSGSTRIGFTIERYGYGYGYQDGTVMFGLVVLLTHAAVAIGYILYSILHRVFGAGFISSAWGDMGEMLALALRSDRARELQNVGGGVEESSTWKMRVRVREVGGDRLELVVGAGDLDSTRPKLDKKYR